MNLTLLRTLFKKNWVLLLIFIGVLTMYMTIMISMYNPDDVDMLNSMLELFPPDLMKVMGFSNIVTNLTEYLGSWLYGLLMFGFPMVYCIILGNRLVAKMVDNSSFAYLLSTPNSRTKIILTKGFYAIGTVFLLFLTLFGVGVIVSKMMFPGALDIGAFLKLNITTMLVNMVVMMISFFFSCLFNETKLSLSFGAGIPITFLLMNMLGGASEKLEIFKKMTIYGFYDPVELIQSGNILGVNLIYFSLSIILFTSSVIVFKNKRLPL